MVIASFKSRTGTYEVTSYGNGWAYEVIHTRTGDSIWVQDEDAINLHSETNGFQNEDIIGDYFSTLIVD